MPLIVINCIKIIIYNEYTHQNIEYIYLQMYTNCTFSVVADSICMRRIPAHADITKVK